MTDEPLVSWLIRWFTEPFSRSGRERIKIAKLKKQNALLDLQLQRQHLESQIEIKKAKLEGKITETAASD